jgi:hypothetical protein
MIHPDATVDECMEEISALEAEIKQLRLKVNILDGIWVQQLVEIERLEAALTAISEWARAYPLKVFPEPDFAKAHALLQAGGMTLDAISASAIRHVVIEISKIADRALAEKP